MSKIYIGKIVNTHAIKGELRIRSDFDYKEKAFKINNNLIIENENYKIRTYRKHKTFDMVTLNEYNNINQVLFLVGKKVYINEEELKLSSYEVLDKDLLKYTVITNTNETGKVIEIIKNPNNKLIKIKLTTEHLIPYNKEFIKINKSEKTIEVKLIKGL